MRPAMELFVDAQGVVRRLYDERLDLAPLGPAAIARAAHVEPDARGRWFADLAPSGGPRLGPFARRSLALAAEAAWLADRLAAAE
ncbi:MAG: hypothetical protein KF847_19355 [Pirellulales bacterium]|nr:hypothetical protein [Pirellulales bacterium]